MLHQAYYITWPTGVVQGPRMPLTSAAIPTDLRAVSGGTPRPVRIGQDSNPLVDTNFWQSTAQELAKWANVSTILAGGQPVPAPGYGYPSPSGSVPPAPYYAAPTTGVPAWVWLAGAGGLGLVLVLMLSGGGGKRR